MSKDKTYLKFERVFVGLEQPTLVDEKTDAINTRYNPIQIAETLIEILPRILNLFGPQIFVPSFMNYMGVKYEYTQKYNLATQMFKVGYQSTKGNWWRMYTLHDNPKEAMKMLHERMIQENYMI